MKHLSFNFLKILFITFLLFSIKNSSAQATFYGVSENGGKDGIGGVFSVDYKGENFTKVYEFNYKTQGFFPNSKLLEVGNGKLYGVTQSGGDSTKGVLFEYDIASQTYKDIYSFGDSMGRSPVGELIIGNTSTTLFGITYWGGKYNAGTLYSYNISTKTFKVLYHFDGGVSGSYPNGFFTKANNGVIYGTLKRGAANNYGSLFSYNPSTSTFTIEHAFSGAFPNPVGELAINTTETTLYGSTERGGNNNGGILYALNLNTKAITKISDISAGAGFGRTPFSGVVLYNDTAIYGAAYSGGSTNRGTLYKYSIPNNKMETVLMFHDSIGASPTSSISITADKKIAGTTSQNGKNNGGCIYSYSLASDSLSVLASFDLELTGGNPRFNFITASNGKWYGIVGNNYTNKGAIDVYDPQTSSLKSIFNFGENKGGAYPSSVLVEGANGRLYGVAPQGGNRNDGTIYELDPDTKTLSEKLSFYYNSTGSYPFILAAASNGKLYGATEDGVNNYGYIFEYDPATNTLTNKVDLSIKDISLDYPFTLNDNTLFYGFTDHGGKDDEGFIFSYQPGDTQIIERASFWEGITENPRYKLAQLSNGNFIGTFQRGNGGLFEYDVASDTIKNLYNFTNASGTRPSTVPFIASDGNIYGFTRSWGNNSRGTFYKLDYATKQLEVLYHLQDDTLRYVYFDVSESDSGLLIGASQGGGTNGRGVVFTYDIKTKTLTTKYNFSDAGNFASSDGGFYKYCEPFDGGLSIDKGISLETKTLGDKYQWYNCLDTSPVLNANNRKLTPSLSSRYGALVVKQGCTYQTDCENLFILNIDKLVNTKLGVYPNPSSTSITVNLEGVTNAKGFSVEIYNSTGQKVANAQLGKVNISPLPIGIYFVVAQNNGKRYTAKFIKN